MPVHALTQETIARHIFIVRDHKVMLDSDLADLYGVATKVLVQAVKRNRLRFPSDFVFQLTQQDVTNLKSQILTSSLGQRTSWGGRRKPVNAFTEQGVAMLSSVLRSPRAIAANIAPKKLDELERRISGHDEAISGIIKAIRDLATPPATKPKRRIGFVTQD